LILNGYSDWHLPTKEELNALYVNLYPIGVGGFASAYYWSSSEGANYGAWYQYFDGGNQNYIVKIGTSAVRAVRAF